MKKKLLSIILSVFMLICCISVLPFTASAATGTPLVTFEFGANGTAAHKDGSAISTGKTYTQGDYTLKLDAVLRVYDGALDAKGNSALKLGTSSGVASFSFTVSDEVMTVVIKVAGYKAKTSKISVNGGDAQTLTASSDKGEYEEISVDTSANKTVAFATVSGATRAMIDSISFYGAACTHENKVPVGEAKDATCTEDGITAGEKCAACGEVFAEQEVIPATGHIDENPVDSKCDVCEANLCTEHAWVDGEVITPATCTSTGLQAQYCKNCNEPGDDKEIEKVAHTPETDAAVDATCTTTGLTEGSHCSVCKEVFVAQEVVDMVAHNYVDGACSVCGDVFVEGTKLADFEFGENGKESHWDGDEIKEEQEYIDGEYTLTLNTASKVYSAFDAKGNSALKLGTGSAAANLGFTVGDSVKKVVIYVAGYKANTAKLKINEGEYTVSSQSNEGNYTKIIVDTSSTKTVTVTTLNGGYRAMIDSIEFWGVENAAVEAEDKLAGYTVTLGDSIGVNFYMSLTAATLADETAYMQFTLPSGTTTNVYVKDVTEANGSYKFACDIAVKEMADDITGQLFNESGALTEAYTYSVKAYANYIIGATEGYSANEIALAKALLNYGAYAQVMFNYNVENLANSELTEEDKAIDGTISDEFVKNVTANVAGATYKGTTTIWESDMAIRHYFDITGENVTFKLYTAEGEFIQDLEVLDSDNGKYVVIDEIVAKDMATTYKLSVNDGEAEQTISYSVYSYFYDILGSNDYSDSQKDTMKAAYLYAEAAIRYLADK